MTHVCLCDCKHKIDCQHTYMHQYEMKLSCQFMQGIKVTQHSSGWEQCHIASLRAHCHTSSQTCMAIIYTLISIWSPSSFSIIIHLHLSHSRTGTISISSPSIWLLSSKDCLKCRRNEPFSHVVVCCLLPWEMLWGLVSQLVHDSFQLAMSRQESISWGICLEDWAKSKQTSPNIVNHTHRLGYCH